MTHAGCGRRRNPSVEFEVIIQDYACPLTLTATQNSFCRLWYIMRVVGPVSDACLDAVGLCVEVVNLQLLPPNLVSQLLLLVCERVRLTVQPPIDCIIYSPIDGQQYVGHVVKRLLSA